MDNKTLWSLRLGFSGKQAGLIEKEGIQKFVKNSFAVPIAPVPASLMKGELRIPTEIEAYRIAEKKRQEKGWQAIQIQIDTKSFEIKSWWISQMMAEKYPLREKMTVFWHNHYVTALRKVQVNSWIVDHNIMLRKNAFGNFRELTKKVLYTNAMIKYLDNNNNKKSKLNENLSRELLELFTIGVGHYSENDVKNGAKALAGLTLGPEGAVYDVKQEFTEPFTYLGKTGKFKANDIVDIIFEQKAAPYFVTRKLLKWFIYDNPPEELVTYYGDYLRKVDFELEPFLLKVFTEEFAKPTGGSKIKDPLVFTLHLMDELNITNQNNKVTAVFIRGQGMDLYNQVNVKGWDGGKSWLSTQLFSQRNNIADTFCKGQNLSRKSLYNLESENETFPEKLNIHIDWVKKGTNKEIIAQLKNRLLFTADDSLQKDFEAIITHDFDPNSESADKGILRLFNYMVNSPEFQIV